MLSSVLSLLVESSNRIDLDNDVFSNSQRRIAIMKSVEISSEDLEDLYDLPG